MALLSSAAGCESAASPRPLAARPAAVHSAVSTPRSTASTAGSTAITSGPTASGGTAAAHCPPAPYGAQREAPGTGKTVALTFDDGPGPNTAAILATLARYQVPATFFNIGMAMATRPELVRDEVRDGYATGNHSWDHPDLTSLPAAGQAAELAQASVEQQAIAGTVPCAFRPPYGKYDATTLMLAQQDGMSVWLWSTDTLDWMADGSDSSYWVHRIIALAEQGAALPHPVLLLQTRAKATRRRWRRCRPSSGFTAPTGTGLSR